MVAALGLVAMAASAVAFDEALAVRDLQITRATMCDPGLLENWTCPSCGSIPLSEVRVASNESYDALALTATEGDDGLCLLTFRGSATPLNYLEDAAFFPTRPYGSGCPDCAVHSGFYDTWASLRPQVLAHVEELKCTRLEMTGHSLGGAQAALAAFELAARLPVERLYTYGQPRVGNVAWTANFTALGLDYFRVVNYKDAVPHLPLSDMFWEGWTHPVPEVYYNATARGTYHVCAGSATDRNCSYQWNLVETLLHTCDHCSYLGMDPCACADLPPQCEEPRAAS